MAEDRTADERRTLTQMLDLQRRTLRWKLEGLDQAQANTTLGPSSLHLAGLVKHMTLVEEGWFMTAFLGGEHSPPFDAVDWDADPDWEFRTAADDDPADLLAAYDAMCASSREIVAEAALDDLCVRSRPGQPVNLRWVLVHMIEETARHAGHADLLRESIDGCVGDFPPDPDDADLHDADPDHADPDHPDSADPA
jgi:uncharacterized damage-inducible protein DinB